MSHGLLKITTSVVPGSKDFSTDFRGDASGFFLPAASLETILSNPPIAMA